MKIKFILILTVVLLIAIPAFGASLDQWMLAEYLAQPEGRSVASGTSVVLKLWFDDDTNVNPNYAQIGVSSTTLNLYEAGAIVSTTRFGGSDGSIELTNGSYDTLGELITAINGDTSRYWNAKLGPDGFNSMKCIWMMPYIVEVNDDVNESEFTYYSIISANTVKSDAREFTLDPHLAHGMTCGVEAEADARVRLKLIEESTTSSRMPHWIEVYSGDDIIYRQGFGTEESCLRDDAVAEIGGVNIHGDSSTPNTINLADGHKGVGGAKGKNLCVFTRWDTTGTFRADYSSPATGSLSIIYDVIKP